MFTRILVGGVAGLGLLLVAQTARLNHAKHQLTDTRRNLTKAVADWSAMRDAIVNPKTGWVVAYKRLEDVRTAEARQCATNIERASQARSQAAESGFDNGYAAGRSAGRKTCGVPDAKASPARPGAVSDGVRPRPDDDLAVLFGKSAYKPR